jgi:hypothetical protein
MGGVKQRPIFGFLWPDRSEPLDHNAHQRRMVRIPGRGPLRLLTLMTATVGVVALSGSVLLAASGVGWIAVVFGAFVVASLTVVVLRAWVVGTYVNDDGFAVQRLFRADVGPWRDVWSVEDDDGRIVLRLVTGVRVPTHIARRGLDLLARPTAYDMAALRFQRWREGT